MTRWKAERGTKKDIQLAATLHNLHPAAGVQLQVQIDSDQNAINPVHERPC
jgi:hypothetical protein